MQVRTIGFAVVMSLAALSVRAQVVTVGPERPFSADFIGGLAAGQGSAGGALGASMAFDVTDHLGLEARGLRSDRGSGERGLEVSGSVRVTLARTARAEPYASIGGGVYRASFDLGDSRFFGRMAGQYPAGMYFAPIQGAAGFAMMGPGYAGMAMWQGPWSGPTFRSSQMPMFYANRLGSMTIPANGVWSSRAFTDPALTFGGGLRLNLTDRFYLAPDVRGIAVFSSGDHLTMVTMNVGLGIRF